MSSASKVLGCGLNSMSLVIRDATVITCDASRTVLRDAAVAVEGDRIAAVGPTAEVAPKFPNAELVDGRGKAVLPGLINSHTHVWYTAARGMQEDFGYPPTIPTDVHNVL